jgi:hypothetical protein
VDKLVPVQALTKCKMQDNLEFLQWAKRYWDQYYPGGEYDAAGRRRGASMPAGAAAGGPRASGMGAARKTPAASAAAPRTRTPQTGGVSSVKMRALQEEKDALAETVAGLERERDFYFSKLRDVELLVQNQFEIEPELEKDENHILKQIQAILYSTEVSLIRRAVFFASGFCANTIRYRRALKSQLRKRVLKRRLFRCGRRGPWWTRLLHHALTIRACLPHMVKECSITRSGRVGLR